jgi:hypothetical protein
MKNFSHQREPDGYPNYVRAWSRKAEVGTMQRGYRDVCYLLAPHVGNFRRHKTAAAAWQHAVSRFREFCLSGNAQEVLVWCRETYPGVLKAIPRTRHVEFVAGMIERAWRDAACPC